MADGADIARSDCEGNVGRIGPKRWQGAQQNKVKISRNADRNPEIHISVGAGGMRVESGFSPQC
jgi:hypothetical protein